MLQRKHQDLPLSNIET